MEAVPSAQMMERETQETSTARRLFDLYHLPVYRFLRRISREPELAEELTQEAFLRVVRAMPRYQDRGEERAWIFRIARNLLLNRWRDRGRRPGAVALADVPLASVSPRQQAALVLEEALEGLGETERECFLLRELGGLGYGEIAAVTGRSPDAVRSLIYRARRALREALSEEGRADAGASGESRR